jgi:hypothetical protein
MPEPVMIETSGRPTPAYIKAEIQALARRLEREGN